MKIAVIGCGYVGLTTALGFSAHGHDVIAVEQNVHRLAQLKNGELPIHEPGLYALMQLTTKDRQTRESYGMGDITFVNDLKLALDYADVIFVCVGTTLDREYESATIGVANLADVFNASMHLLHGCKEKKRFVIKSTITPGTIQWLLNQAIFPVPTNTRIIFNPEFLQEGKAYEDFQNPHRVVIGTQDGSDDDMMYELYKPFTPNIIFTTWQTAEMAKLAANTMLAARLTVLNEIAYAASKYEEVSVPDLVNVLGCDPRIGEDYLKPGIGWGGSCLPKDVTAMTELAKVGRGELHVISSLTTSNRSIITEWADKWSYMIEDHEDERTVVAIWGQTFKADTDDIRESPAMQMIDDLMSYIDTDVLFKIYDPSGTKPIKIMYPSIEVQLCETIHETVIDAHAIVLLTDWQEFKDYDPAPCLLTMAKRRVFDGRNALDPEKYLALGFDYHGIGITKPFKKDEKDS